MTWRAVHVMVMVATVATVTGQRTTAVPLAVGWAMQAVGRVLGGGMPLTPGPTPPPWDGSTSATLALWTVHGMGVLLTQAAWD